VTRLLVKKAPNLVQMSPKMMKYLNKLQVKIWEFQYKNTSKSEAYLGEFSTIKKNRPIRSHWRKGLAQLLTQKQGDQMHL
jgi:hypothetical protein